MLEKYNVEVNDFEYVNLEDLYLENGKDKVYKALRFSINTKSRYGEHPMVEIDGFMVNLPRHLLESIEQLINDNVMENIEVGFKIYEYEMRNRNGVFYSINLIEL